MQQANHSTNENVYHSIIIRDDPAFPDVLCQAPDRTSTALRDRLVHPAPPPSVSDRDDAVFLLRWAAAFFLPATVSLRSSHLDWWEFTDHEEPQ